MNKVRKLSMLAVIVFFACMFTGCTELFLETSDDTETIFDSTGEIVTELEVVTETQKDEDYILFGNYEQDSDVENGSESIQWILLDDNGDSCLLLSRYILDYKDFNDTTIAKATSWGNSTLREWLNNDFVNSAFTESEQNEIKWTEVQDYKSENQLGDITSDKVFILSYSQVLQYFPDEWSSATTSTEYAKTQKSYVTDSYWLIDSHSSALYKYLINSEGIADNKPRVNESEGIRPAIWVSKTAIEY